MISFAPGKTLTRMLAYHDSKRLRMAALIVAESQNNHALV
jgi:hypothetical protein